MCRDLILRVKLTKRPLMKYGIGTNKGTLKVRKKYGESTVAYLHTRKKLSNYRVK